MSIIHTFDPDSEEIVQVKLSRSYQPVENFPETVIMTFQDRTFRLLQQVCPAEPAAVLRGGREIPVYALCWQGRRVGILHSLMGGAGTVCLLEGILARGAKKVLLYGPCGALDEGIAAGRFILPTGAWRKYLMNWRCHTSWARSGQPMAFTARRGTIWRNAGRRDASP